MKARMSTANRNARMESVMEGLMAVCGPRRASQSRTKKKDPAAWALHGCACWKRACEPAVASPPWPAWDLHSLYQPAVPLGRLLAACRNVTMSRIFVGFFGLLFLFFFKSPVYTWKPRERQRVFSGDGLESRRAFSRLLLASLSALSPAQAGGVRHTHPGPYCESRPGPGRTRPLLEGV